MTEDFFETPIMRDISKLLLPVVLGVAIAMIALLMFQTLSGEIRFNVTGAMEGYDIINDRYGGCFHKEVEGGSASYCSSGAWPISILYIIPLIVLIPFNIYLIWRRRNRS